MSIDTLIYLFVGVITVTIPLIYILRDRKANAEASAALQKAVERGLDEPISLHPIVDVNSCISTGACVKACPEDRVIGLIDGKASLINPSRCIGHGLCAEACPVQAITLVFGTTKRGIDIPVIDGNFQSTVPGMYITGELGGMGLIRNAITQGSKAVAHLTKSLGASRGQGELLDLVIVGAGPAGIGATLQAKKEGLKFVTLDQDDLGGTILSYPRRKLVMTQPMELPLHGEISSREISKEALLDLFTGVFAKEDLAIHSSEKCETIEKSNGGFKVVSAKREYLARKVILAIGRRGSPKKLEVPGEKSSKVAYSLMDPEKFHDLKILVVGGGDSAVEAAVALGEQPGNQVHISYRREGFFRIKDGNQTRIDHAIREGRVRTLFNSEVKSIESDRVVLSQNSREVSVPNDQVFVFVGGEMPSEFLRKAGIEVVRKFGEK